MDCHWKWNNPQFIRTFLRLAMNNTLKTKEFLFKMHIITDIQCPRCGYAVEMYYMCFEILFMQRKCGVCCCLQLVETNSSTYLWHYIFAAAVWRLWL